MRPKSIWFDNGEDPAVRTAAPALDPVQQRPTAVVVPPAEPEPAAAANDAPGVRLPIYDSVESEWFPHSAGVSWAGHANEDFRRAAETTASPVAGQLTNAGLPKRIPSANLVPGSINARSTGPEQAASATGPSRSPEQVRARLTGFQLRGREGRTDVPQGPRADTN